jgi:hypothetical protein
MVNYILVLKFVHFYFFSPGVQILSQMVSDLREKTNLVPLLGYVTCIIT